MTTLEMLRKFVTDIVYSSGRRLNPAEPITFSGEFPFHIFNQLQKELLEMAQSSIVVNSEPPTFERSRFTAVVFPEGITLEFIHTEIFSLKEKKPQAKVLPMFTSPKRA
jgi:hypothetical protein